MRARRIALLVAIAVGFAGIATAQTVWVEHPDNPLVGPFPGWQTPPVW